MERSTVKALIIAGGAILGALVQVFVLRAAKKKKREEYEAATLEKEASLEEGLKDD